MQRKPHVVITNSQAVVDQLRAHHEVEVINLAFTPNADELAAVAHALPRADRRVEFIRESLVDLDTRLRR